MHNRALVEPLFVTSLLAAACGHAPSGPNPLSEERPAAAATSPSRVKLLTAQFAPRVVRKIEVGDFHFTPGQIAPIHTHAAPALGYVSKGSIVYQVEGQPTQTLATGDAFFEPVGPRILHFDNASKTEEAVFTDFNFERTGEPFIVFPEPPVNLKIDRRTLPTVEVASAPEITTIQIYAQTIAPGASIHLDASALPVMGYVAAGKIDAGNGELRPGQSFDLASDHGERTVLNAGAEPAKIITFEPHP